MERVAVLQHLVQGRARLGRPEAEQRPDRGGADPVVSFIEIRTENPRQGPASRHRIERIRPDPGILMPQRQGKRTSGRRGQRPERGDRRCGDPRRCALHQGRDLTRDGFHDPRPPEPRQRVDQDIGVAGPKQPRCRVREQPAIHRTRVRRDRERRSTPGGTEGPGSAQVHSRADQPGRILGSRGSGLLAKDRRPDLRGPEPDHRGRIAVQPIQQRGTSSGRKQESADEIRQAESGAERPCRGGGDERSARRESTVHAPKPGTPGGRPIEVCRRQDGPCSTRGSVRRQPPRRRTPARTVAEPSEQVLLADRVSHARRHTAQGVHHRSIALQNAFANGRTGSIRPDRDRDQGRRCPVIPPAVGNDQQGPVDFASDRGRHGAAAVGTDQPRHDPEKRPPDDHRVRAAGIRTPWRQCARRTRARHRARRAAPVTPGPLSLRRRSIGRDVVGAPAATAVRREEGCQRNQRRRLRPPRQQHAESGPENRSPDRPICGGGGVDQDGRQRAGRDRQSVHPGRRKVGQAQNRRGQCPRRGSRHRGRRQRLDFRNRRERNGFGEEAIGVGAGKPVQPCRDAIRCVHRARRTPRTRSGRPRGRGTAPWPPGPARRPRRRGCVRIPSTGRASRLPESTSGDSRRSRIAFLRRPATMPIQWRARVGRSPSGGESLGGKRRV